MTEQSRKIRFAEILLTVCLFGIGTFHEYLSCAASVAMLVWLICQAVRKRQIRITLNLTSVSILCILLFYGLTAFWAVDSGMAIIGLMKFLPVGLYLLVLMQADETEGILSRLPLTASVMTVVAAIGMQIPVFTDFFSVSGRLAGFFQYPNTFALFALVAELLVLSKEKLRVLDFAEMAILLFGILYSGSRTVFVLAAVSNVVLIFTLRNRRVRLWAVAILGVAAVGVGIYAAVAGADGVFGRFLTISLNESTFVGRLLYFQDALPLILRHPFGLGYMGYYYLQQSVQTGVYSVMFVHNDFLQLLLDVGWLPALLFAAAILKGIFGGKKPLYMRVILAVIALHGCFDFDLQFIAMFMLMLFFMDYGKGRQYTVKPGMVGCVGVATAALCLYFGIAQGFSHFGNAAAALAVYPYDTRSETQLLVQETNAKKAAKRADRILSRNPYVTVAYSVKARQAFSSGDFGQLIEWKQQIFENAPFAYEEYEEYGYMLIQGISLYTQAGDTASVQICRKELQSVARKVHTAEKRLSSLGAKIKDQPKTQFPEDLEEYIKMELTAEP